LITLKLATSLDGRIATAAGESRWITGEAAREQVHKLRAMHQAVLVGIETAIADNPELTVRLPGYIGPQPTRVVLDNRQRQPITGHLLQEANRLDTVVITTSQAKPTLTGGGVTVLTVEADDGRPNLTQAVAAIQRHVADRLRQPLSTFYKTGLADTGQFPLRLMIEGGGQVAASFLAAGLVDVIEWFRAPIILGDEGRPAVGDFVLNRLKDAPRFKRIEVSQVGDDLWERYEKL
jgi:diaminohydroxyphosphoribosylaminopyrimidine deaminase/5-amino-6-(5-phosphoribosylamino)uracil reductase